MTKSTSGGCDQFETSPEANDQELRTAFCERRQTDRLKTNYRRFFFIKYINFCVKRVALVMHSCVCNNYHHYHHDHDYHNDEDEEYDDYTYIINNNNVRHTISGCPHVHFSPVRILQIIWKCPRFNYISRRCSHLSVRWLSKPSIDLHENLVRSQLVAIQGSTLQDTRLVCALYIAG